MCADELEPSDVVDDVLASLAEPRPPDVRGLGPRAWKAITLPTSHAMRLATIGLLPRRARRALDLEWTGQSNWSSTRSAASRAPRRP